jgi:hypothetical protein
VKQIFFYGIPQKERKVVAPPVACEEAHTKPPFLNGTTNTTPKDFRSKKAFSKMGHDFKSFY